MEYDEENSSTGCIPEFGAIFMSNTLTKKECFKRNVFALPSSMAKFVRHVKAGMVLFLFEFEMRQLFGVFQASSDGAMDIVPHGFNYSGRCFPAQVCFTPIWFCNPLSEKEFKDAIRENYFSPKKFNFGLSETQVRRLLALFSSRKLKTKLPPRMMREVAEKAAGEDRGLVGDAGWAFREKSDMEYDNCNPSRLCDYQRNSVLRATSKDVVNSEGEVYPVAGGLQADHHDSFPSKRKRVRYENEVFINSERENEISDDLCASRSLCIDPPVNSLDEVRRSVDGRGSLTVAGVYNENRVDSNINPVGTSKYSMGPLGVRKADYDLFMHRNRSSDYNLEYTFREHCGRPSNKNRHAIDHDSFLFDNCIRKEYNVHDIIRPVELEDGEVNLYAQRREMVDDHLRLMNGKMENRNHVHGDGPVSLSEQFKNPLHKLSKLTADCRFPTNDRTEGEQNFGPFTVAGFSSANYALPLHSDHKTTDDEKLSIKGRVSENMIDNVISSSNSEFIAGADGGIGDYGRFRMSDRIENLSDVNTFDCPVGSNDSFFSKLKQNLSSSNKSLTETGLSRFSLAQNFDPARMVFDDSTITRAVPYIPDLPTIAHGPTSLAADWNANSLQEKHPYYGTVGTFYSSSESLLSPFSLDPHQSIKSLDVALEYVNRGSSANISSQQSSSCHKTSGTFLNSNLSVRRALNTSPPVDCRNSLFSLPSAHPDGDNIEGEDRMFVYPSGSSDNYMSQHVREYVPRKIMDMSACKDFISSEAKDFTGGDYHPERDLPSYDNQLFKFSSNMDFGEHQKIYEAPDSNISRRSVFTRLASGQDVQVEKEKKDPYFNCDDHYMDASADEVMEFLKQGSNLPWRNMRKSRVIGRPRHVESALDENSGTSRSKTEKKKVKDAYPVTGESRDEAPKETRIVDFKRRSETKKSFVGATTDPVEVVNNTNNGEVESPTKKILKRKKLVRPVFGNMELAVEGIGNGQKQQSSSLIHKDGKQNYQDSSLHKGKVPNDKAMKTLASHSHQMFEGNTMGHLNTKEEKHLGAHLSPSTIHDLEKGHNTMNVGLQTGSLRVSCKETTHHEGISPQTSVSILKETDSAIESLNRGETCSGELELDAVSGNLREEKKLGMLKKKKRIIRTSKAGM